MPYVWKPPDKFLKHRGVSIFHAYKDELSDLPLGFWYSTCDCESPASRYEFDVRDLPGYSGPFDRADRTENERVIRAAIEAGLLRPDTAFRGR